MSSVFLDFVLPNATTWFYLSFLLMIAVYFRFDRFFTPRNWDLISLFLIVPGLLATTRLDKGILDQLATADQPASQRLENMVGLLQSGYVWLFALTGYFLVRCVVDLFLTRRPRLEPNLSAQGLAFLGTSLLAFLMYVVITKEADPAGRVSARAAVRVLRQNDPGGERPGEGAGEPANLPTAIIRTPVRVVLNKVADSIAEEDPLQTPEMEVAVARTATILCHLLIVAALVLIGWRHFASKTTGVGMATLYLLVPLTALNVEKIDHLIPAAFLVWAVSAFRYPRISGMLFGLAGVFFYPLFLVPLWAGFYWRRGAGRFLVGFVNATAIVLLLMMWIGPLRSFMEVWSSSVAWKAWDFRQDPATLGFWSEATQVYRLPIFIVFCAAMIGVAFWPREKNLAELIALSVALTLGVQFWYGDRGGTYIHWYLPLLLLMIFRPNLEDVRPPEVRTKPT